MQTIQINDLANLLGFQEYTIKKYYHRSELSRYRKGQFVDVTSFQSLINLFNLKLNGSKYSYKFKFAIEVLNDIKGI